MSRRRLLAGGLLLWATAACARDEQAAPSQDDAAKTLLDPDAFAAEVEAGGREVINVHVPDEGAIPGTTLTVPFDQLDAREDDLPGDRSTPLAVYCMTGRMSEVAVATLRSMGFTDVIELRGGMQAWVDGGRPLSGATASGSREASL